MLTPRVIFFAIFAAGALVASVNFGVNTAVNNAIFRESVDKATHWGNHMASHVPDIELLVRTGIPTHEQATAIDEIKSLGDIFRFNLFTADGRLSLVSDWGVNGDYQGTSDVADPEPLEVAQTRTAIVDVYDGTNKPDRPDLYAEAYIPLLGGDGSVLGVVEVYVDQTATASYFRDSFRIFGFLLTLFCGVIFAIPSVAYYLQRIIAERSRKDAEYLARYDPLTGLMNRREFTTLAEAAIAEGRMTAACYLDVDYFKTINDTHGHAVGDAFLTHIADILRENCRKEDLIARFGGDEFVLGLYDISAQDADHRVRAIMKKCSEKVQILSANLAGSVSMGLVHIEPRDDLENCLQNADTALYHSKTSGRNRFSVYGDQMGKDLRLRYELEARIRTAVENLEFEIFFQPLVSSVDKQVTGFEALLRLRDDDGQIILPSVFIPIAENLGLIEEIGNWTIETATQQIANAHIDKTISINLSSIQFESGRLVKTVRNALQKSGLPAKQLELEITESLLLEDSEAVEMQIDALRDMGVTIAMDDFGTGFSSLSYLWKYGFDRLKIDQSFVAALEGNTDRSREIIESVIMLGARLNMKITAEGVETAEQSKLLADLGCDTLQGYLFGMPVPFANLNISHDPSEGDPRAEAS